NAGITFGKTEKGEPVYIAANDRKKGKDKFYTLLTAPGGEFVLRLPDSTMIWMNSASAVKYPANFDQDTIRIGIQGEAYVERLKENTHHYLIGRISPDSNRQTSVIQVQPKSTLNINTYPQNGDMIVSLIHGTASWQKTDINYALVSGVQQ